MNYFVSYQVVSREPESEYVVRSMANHVVEAPTPLTPVIMKALEEHLTRHVLAHPDVFGPEADAVLVHVIPLSHDLPGEPAPEIRDGFA